MHAYSHPPIGGPFSAPLGLSIRLFAWSKSNYASVSREAAVVYQMGSYYSLWVTDPYDLEIGSTKATRFSCSRSKAK